ncbi:MAG: MFS transporter, partial [Candidatus Marinimicrobia bacterium]|nr:MFS transporter [Candidatus Neomarinimicrobiota bacterium]
WMINANAGLIVIFVVFVSWLVSKLRRVTAIFIGIAIASVGLIAAGFTMNGWFVLMGIAMFSVGEMLASPKMNEYLGVIAPPGEKALYMGYANIPLAVGWGYGSLMGGKIYDQMGDKANLAIRYMQENLNISEEISRNEAFKTLMEVTGKTALEATDILWNTYHPYELWYQFAFIGMLSAVGIFIYSLVMKKYEGNI